MSTATPNEQRGTHSSVVYIHGMGEQRQFEEVCRLIDALDMYAHNAGFAYDERVGVLKGIRVAVEPERGPFTNKRDVPYIGVVRDPKARGVPSTEHRFYEAYWAPQTAGGSSARTVMQWLLCHVATPLRTLASPWRSRQRLRRAALHTYWTRTRGTPDELSESDVWKLLDAYNKFEGWTARRKFPKGRFNDYVAFLAKKWEKRPETTKRLLGIARAWRSYYIRSELRTLFLLLTLLVAIVLGLLAAGALGLVTLRWLNDLSGIGPDVFGDFLEPSVASLSKIVVVLLALLGVTGFVKNYLGDVQAWATFEQTDKKYETREKILRAACRVLAHVVDDKDCDRVVVVAHSLGTAVAMDALLELGRYNQARSGKRLRLDKISHFVSLASPIDKIHFFFESHRGKYHRYVRVVDQFRGDLGAPPFAWRLEPKVHWINFWDQADIISSSLETPTNRRRAGLRVDNAEVASLWFPDPAWSHSAYFENRNVIRTIFELVFENAYSFANAQTTKYGSHDQQLMVGPGEGRKTTLVFQAIGLAIPWMLGISAVAAALDAPVWAQHASFTAAAASLIVTIVGLIVGRIRGPTLPVKVNQSVDRDL